MLGTELMLRMLGVIKLPEFAIEDLDTDTSTTLNNLEES